MKTQVVTSATGEPVDLEEMKDHLGLNLGKSLKDTLLKGFIHGARRRVEDITGRKLMTQTWKYYLDRWPRNNYINLPYSPLIHITSSTGVIYKDSDGSTYLMASTGANSWKQDTVSEPGRLVLENNEDWPSESLYHINPIAIQFQCGYGTSDAGDANKTPEELKLAVKMLAGHWYENREASIVAQSMEMVPQGFSALLAPYKMYKF